MIYLYRNGLLIDWNIEILHNNETMNYEFASAEGYINYSRHDNFIKDNETFTIVDDTPGNQTYDLIIKWRYTYPEAGYNTPRTIGDIAFVM